MDCAFLRKVFTLRKTLHFDLLWLFALSGGFRIISGVAVGRSYFLCVFIQSDNVLETINVQLVNIFVQEFIFVRITMNFRPFTWVFEWNFKPFASVYTLLFSFFFGGILVIPSGMENFCCKFCLSFMMVFRRAPRSLFIFSQPWHPLRFISSKLTFGTYLTDLSDSWITTTTVSLCYISKFQPPKFSASY